jgi:hypothetical protein
MTDRQDKNEEILFNEMMKKERKKVDGEGVGCQ